MSKKFGQNFLINASVLNRIADIADIKPTDNVWEIGPGLGALTNRLLRTEASVTAFEIDKGFCKILREQAFTNCKNFKLIEGDVLKCWKQEVKQSKVPDVICANLPYNVGSVFIASLIENRCLPKRMVFTLQTEVVKRICAKIGDNQYSGFSILTSIDYINTEVLTLKSGNFWPAPNVDSSVVLMQKRENSLIPENLAEKFLNLCKILFSQRRKTVKNNLKIAGYTTDKIDTALKNSSISPTERAEKLTIPQIQSLLEFL